MALDEKEVRAYMLKTRTYVCPVCVLGEEKADPATRIVAEDEIHDSNPMECARCKTAIK